MMQVTETSDDLVVIEVSGSLNREDYQRVLPQLEDTVKRYGAVRALVDVHDWSGMTPPAFFDEMQFDVDHRDDIARCAVVGDSGLQKVLTKLAGSVSPGQVRFFPREQRSEAKNWLRASDGAPR